MKSISKTIIFALLLSVIPARIWAQDLTNHAQGVIRSQDANLTQKAQIRDYESGFLFNVFEIENVEERVQLASALATSDIWICNPTDNPGELYIRPNSYHADIPIYAEFDYLRMTLREEYDEVSSLPKEEFAEIFNSWAHNISSEYYNFLISDHLDRANHCMDAEPFCTSDVYNFPALNSGYSWSGPNYGCLGTSPTNKHSFWYYMRIGVAGNITILIEASFDVDFALWGPFTNQNDPCPTEAGQTGLLTANCGDDCPNNTTNPNFYPSGNLHDCSFDARHYEYAHVVDGQVGQYYILLITNYSGSSGNITFQKYAGDGETDCGIMPGIVNNGGPYCVGETIQLTVNEQNSATYSWVGPDGWTSDQQNPTRPNCTMNMAGIYECTTTVGNQSVTASTEVTIYPQPSANFTFTTACEGDPVQFTSTSTTNPTGQEITNFEWDFGDGQTASGQNVSHPFDHYGDYEVTLGVATGNGFCSDQKTMTVTIHAIPQPTVSVSPTSVIYGGTATLTANAEPPGNYTYHWEPADMVTNPNSQTTQTVPITSSQVFTVTVTNTQGGCGNSAQGTVSMAGSDLTATATADLYEICENGSTILHALPLAGTGNYTFSWSPANLLSNPYSQNPEATPPLGATTFTCVVSDGLTEQQVTVTILVHPHEESDVHEAICENGTYNFFGQTLNTPGVYSHTLQTVHGCDSIVRLHLTLNELTSTQFTVSDGENCDEYYWNPQGHVVVYTDHENPVYTESGEYHRTYLDHLGCDSLVTMNVQFEYTPTPTEIYPMDASNTAPHWVVTATEFQINAYDFQLWDTNEHCYWDSVTWSFPVANHWQLEPFGDKNTCCKMYVLEQIEDTVWLEARAYNRCAPQGIVQRYWFVCSFYGIEDSPTTGLGAFDVVPNPNNGQMQLRFESLYGKANVKVYDSRGLLIDSFETYNGDGPFTYPYDMKTAANGIYFFVVTSKEGTVAKKVVIQR